MHATISHAIFVLPFLFTPHMIFDTMCERYVMTTPSFFLTETRDELKKVTWPTRQEVIRLTAVVIAVSVIVGVFIGGLDFVFTKLLTFLIH